MMQYFMNLLHICFKAFGDRVKYWATMNEPNLFVPLGYTAGLFPPRRCSLPFGKCDSGNSMSELYVAAHNVLLAHAATVNIYRTKYQKNIEGGSIGFEMSAPWYEPLEDTADDRAAVDRILAFNIRWFLDPIVLGKYPSEMRERLGSRLPAISGKVAGSFDFIGLNQYTTLYASSAPIPSLDSTTHFYPDSMVYLTGERQGIHIGEPVKSSQFSFSLDHPIHLGHSLHHQQSLIWLLVASLKCHSILHSLI